MRGLSLLPLLGLLVAGLAGDAPDLAPPSPQTDPFVVDTYFAYFRGVAAVPDGDFVVVTADGQARKYSRDGTLENLSTIVGGSEYLSTGSVAARADGGFVAAWGDGSHNSFGGFIDPDGAWVGPRFPVEAAKNLVTGVASDGAGNFVVTLRFASARWFDSSGQPRGPSSELSPEGDLPAVDMTSLGESVFVWHRRPWQEADVFARFYDASGNPVGSEFQLNVHTTGAQGWPDVAVDEDGTFVAVWWSEGQGFVGRCFDSAGAALSDEILLKEGGTPGDRSLVTLGPADDFIAVWSTGLEDATLSGRRMRCDGTGGAEFEVGSFDTYGYWDVDIDTDADSGLVVAWDAVNGSDVETYARRYCAPLLVTAPEDEAICEGGYASFAVSASGWEPLAYQWRLDGIDLVDGTGVAGANASMLTLDDVSAADTGFYDCVVRDACGQTQTVVSEQAILTLGGEAPGPVGDSVRVNRDATTLAITWEDVSDAEDYVVFGDTDPAGMFGNEAGTAPSGSTGLTITIPEPTLYFLVAARNNCDTGPKR